jgi:hypothetical protein
MNTLALFLAGLIITLIVVAGLGLLFYAAVLDGRYNDEQERLRQQGDLANR